ncbi:SPFH domain-containing protein [Frigidibacter sp. SD6-1]|uniref:SPFH domain-containing protein n=1 Tax=Frigidibacter sp. SD6-1 TaxID=3032581 RepID=UPI0024E021CC|nr:SPFH domain-containing protein [Frigidibacter sp. SD6-1]
MANQFGPALIVTFFGLLAIGLILAILFRRVVSTNTVHIVQRGHATTPYGTGLSAGNVYYAWPSWIPRFGVTVIQLPVSNFDLSLHDYEAYDTDRVPFVVHVTSFFRIADTALAAQRVASIEELKEQLMQIVQGAVRKVLAGDKIDTIMLERSKFGLAFTSEVVEQLKQWGVEPVKSMELMDIRDGDGSKVIFNIMAKKTSHIEMESRREVAENKRAAETAEIEAQREIDMRKQEAERAVGEKTAEKDKAVGIANEVARQEVLTQERETRERHMAVARVDEVRRAEIERDKQLVAAEQDRQTTVIIAEGQLAAQQREAEGIKAIGEAKAAAERAMQLAPVEAQIVLAKEIGENAGYQQYLMTIEGIKGYVVVGGEQARALQAAEVKVIANTGRAGEGMGTVMDLFSSKGGTNLAAAVEAFSQSPLGGAVMEKLLAAKAGPALPESTAAEAAGPPAAPASA